MLNKKTINILFLVLINAFFELKAQSALPDSLVNLTDQVSDSLQRTLKPIDEIQNSLNSLDPQDRIKTKTDEMESKINGKLDSSTVIRKTDSLSHAIGKDMDKLDLSGKADNELKKFEEVEAVMDKTEELGDEVDGITGKPEEYLQRMKETKEVRAAQENITEAEILNKEAEAYKKEANEIASGNFENDGIAQEKVENEVGKVKEVQELNKNAGELGKHKAKVEQYKDPEVAKKQAVAKMKEAAKNHFAGREEALKKAMQALKEKKAKYANINKLKDFSDRPKNPLKGEPLKKRLIFGGNFQVHPGNPVALDISPLIGYRFTKKLSAGIGGTYRQSFGKEDPLSYAVVSQAYGGRVFSEYAVAKSFFVHAALESLQTTSSDSISDNMPHQWVHSALAGIGREFKITKKIKGKAMLLYNFLHRENGPAGKAGRLYRKPLMVRFGIGF